jgi:hypothetical protein
MTEQQVQGSLADHEHGNWRGRADSANGLARMGKPQPPVIGLIGDRSIAICHISRVSGFLPGARGCGLVLFTAQDKVIAVDHLGSSRVAQDEKHIG